MFLQLIANDFILSNTFRQQELSQQFIIMLTKIKTISEMLCYMEGTYEGDLGGHESTVKVGKRIIPK